MQAKWLAAIAVMTTGWTQTAAAAPAPLRSGLYEGFVLAVSPGGRVTGHFAMEQGEGVTKRCVFDFAGQAKGDQAIIHSIGSPRLSGQLRAGADTITFGLAQMRSLPGCGLVVPPEAETGIALDRIRPGDWTELARVNSARAMFSAVPGGPAGRSYVVKGDVVGILARQGKQVKIVYPSERKSWVQGWVSATELAPLAP